MRHKIAVSSVFDSYTHTPLVIRMLNEGNKNTFIYSQLIEDPEIMMQEKTY